MTKIAPLLTEYKDNVFCVTCEVWFRYFIRKYPTYLVTTVSAQRDLLAVRKASIRRTGSVRKQVVNGVEITVGNEYTAKQLLRMQGGRCFVCNKVPPAKCQPHLADVFLPLLEDMKNRAVCDNCRTFFSRRKSKKLKEGGQRAMLQARVDKIKRTSRS